MKKYIMHPPKSYFWIGAVCAFLCIAYPILTAIFNFEAFEFSDILFWGLFGSIGVFLAAYVKNRKIVVENDMYTVLQPFRPTQVVPLSEITQVKYTITYATVYVGDKKVFTADFTLSNYDVFLQDLYEAGKLDATQCKDSFIVRGYKGDIIGSMASILCITGFIIWSSFFSDDLIPPDIKPLLFFLCALLILLSLVWLVSSALWNLTVSGDTLIVKTGIKPPQKYCIQDITKANIRGENIMLFVGDQKIAKIAINSEGFPILDERLASEKIPFYYKGDRVERQ